MSEMITSTSNPRVKLVQLLQSKARARRAERKIVLEGARLIADAISTGERPLFTLFNPANANYDLIARLQSLSPTLPVTSEIIRHISETQQSQGIFAVFGLPTPRLPGTPRRVLILDAIGEPGNMGTILRTATGAGADVVLLAPNCVDPYNPKVLRAGMGAHFRVPIVEATWAEIQPYVADCALYAASGSGEVIYSEVDWTQPWALIIGNEAHGVGQDVQTLQPTLISIPMEARTESLNAGVATAVILFEAQRQRRLNQR